MKALLAALALAPALSLAAAPADPCPEPTVPVAPAGASGPTACVERAPVTAGRYDACVGAKACPRAGVPSSPGAAPEVLAALAARCTVGVAARAGEAATCLDAGQAAAYCRSVGRRLPTADEWDLAKGRVAAPASAEWTATRKGRDAVVHGAPPALRAATLRLPDVGFRCAIDLVAAAAKPKEDARRKAGAETACASRAELLFVKRCRQACQMEGKGRDPVATDQCLAKCGKQPQMFLFLDDCMAKAGFPRGKGPAAPEGAR